ncbi:MAG TPA: NrdH-redoxin [Acidimicrobiaceae bacterium]|nr:NrdH-redoxin [Acidimicrobiaceae bacterium]
MRSAGGGLIRLVNESAQVTVYWRPGCPFCSMLRAGLRRHDVEFHEVNIWEEPDAAAFVRSVARGNETVPTVTVGDTALVNPSAREVADLVAAARTSG